jgi:hypothetical protein
VNEVVLIKGPESKRILQNTIEKKILASMCYLSKGKWHVAKVMPIRVDDASLAVAVLPGVPSADGNSQSFEWRPRPVNIHIGQSVGLSLKYDDGKFVFETEVIDFEFSANSSGGIIMLEMPQEIELISRRSYFRVRVPEKLDIKTAIWHRLFRHGETQEKRWQSRLIDLSAGGLQVAIPVTQKPDFSEGQFVQIAFAPMPSEQPMEFSAQIRNILPTADGLCVCYGLQIVGLEASSEGRATLGRLAAATELYFELNKCSDCVRYHQVGLKTKTCVKHFRPDWGCLQQDQNP